MIKLRILSFQRRRLPASLLTLYGLFVWGTLLVTAKGDFWSQGFWTWVILSPEIKILSLKNKNYVFLTSIQCFQLTAWSHIDHLLRDSSICWRGEASEVWRVTFLGWGHANYKLYGWVSKSVLIHNPMFYKPHSIGTHDQNNMHSYCLVTGQLTLLHTGLAAGGKYAKKRQVASWRQRGISTPQRHLLYWYSQRLAHAGHTINTEWHVKE